MFMNLKPNQHKRISFNTTTMNDIIGVHRSPLKFSSPPPTFNFLLSLSPPPSPQIFLSEIFRSPLKLGKGCYNVDSLHLPLAR